MVLRGSGSKQKERLFLISNQGSTRNRAKTKNRKYVSYSGELLHNGAAYEVNAAKSGIYTQILHRMLAQFEICEAKWGRVFVLRFDLHQRFYSQDSKHISMFRKNLSRRLEREYGMSEMGYAWAREQERSKSQHYHFAIMLDGNKIRHSAKLLRIIKDTWQRKTSNTMPTIPKPFYFVDDASIKADAIYRISYLAKVRGKGYRAKQAKDYSCSRLIKPNTNKQ